MAWGIGMTKPKLDASTSARIAALTRWGRATKEERRAATEAARRALEARFLDEPNPTAARNAYYLRMRAARRNK
jgi:hypothetical protein